MNEQGATGEQRPTIWVAIYARKSGDENLNGVVTSIESQVAACRSYIEIQKEKGWQPWPEVFEDPAESGKSLNRPAIDELNRLGFRRKLYQTVKGRLYGGQRFDEDSVLRILQRKVYAGKITNERTGLEFPGQHAPIIESDVFDEVQELMGEHARHERHEYSVNKFGFTLKGLARCGKCGSALVGYVRPKKNKVYRYYRCMAMVDGAPVSCDFMSIISDQLEEMAVRQLEQIGWDKELLAGVVREAEKQARKNSMELEGERRELELNLEDVRKGLGNLRPLLEKCPDLKQLAEEVRRLDAVERELSAHLEKLDHRIAALRDTNYDVAAAQEALQRLGRMLAGLPVARQVAILRSLIRRARAWKDRIELDLNEEAVAGLQGLLVEAAGVAQNA